MSSKPSRQPAAKKAAPKAVAKAKVPAAAKAPKAAPPKVVPPKALKPATVAPAKAAPRPRKFNPLAEHGTIHPPHQGAVYFQDGGYFGADGELLFADRPATPPKIVVDESITVDSEKPGEQVVVTTTREVDPLPAADPKVILTSWLKGEANLPHETVRTLVKHGFGEIIASRDDIIKFLVNTANLLPAELVRVH